MFRPQGKLSANYCPNLAFCSTPKSTHNYPLLLFRMKMPLMGTAHEGSWERLAWMLRDSIMAKEKTPKIEVSNRL